MFPAPEGGFSSTVPRGKSLFIPTILKNMHLFGCVGCSIRILVAAHGVSVVALGLRGRCHEQAAECPSAAVAQHIGPAALGHVGS